MKITEHGTKRVISRTRMVVEDIVRLIQAEAVVPLGTVKNYEYLLFYSPFDMECKIAVVNKKRSHLISIWEDYYRLPEGIRIPKSKLIKRAIKLQRGYVINQIPASTRTYEAKILVYEASKFVYMHNCKQRVPVHGNLHKYLELLEEHFSKIVPIVEENKKRSVSYLVTLIDFKGKVRRRYNINHNTVFKWLTKKPAETA